MAREVHPICKQLRAFRKTAQMSLDEAARQFGMPAVVIGSYERGDRQPPLPKLEEILNWYGYTIAAVPKEFDALRLSSDIVRELRMIANQLEAREAKLLKPSPVRGEDSNQVGPIRKK